MIGIDSLADAHRQEEIARLEREYLRDVAMGANIYEENEELDGYENDPPIDEIEATQATVSPFSLLSKLRFYQHHQNAQNDARDRSRSRRDCEISSPNASHRYPLRSQSQKKPLAITIF